MLLHVLSVKWTHKKLSLLCWIKNKEGSSAEIITWSNWLCLSRLLVDFKAILRSSFFLPFLSIRFSLAFIHLHSYSLDTTFTCNYHQQALHTIPHAQGCFFVFHLLQPSLSDSSVDFNAQFILKFPLFAHHAYAR